MFSQKKHKIFDWFTSVIFLTIITIFIYVAAQEIMRASANYPQIKIAESTAARLSQGESATTTVASTTIDISESLTPFIITYDNSGNLETSQAILDGFPPPLPQTVLNYTQKHGENKLTWQPEDGVRIATVILHYSGKQSGFVLVGRSLSKIEIIENDFGLGIFMTWIFLIALISVNYLEGWKNK